jgi:hypothetical protein
LERGGTIGRLSAYDMVYDAAQAAFVQKKP